MSRPDHASRYRIIHPAPPSLIREAELADEALNRNPDGLLGRVGPAEVMLGLAVAFAVGAALAMGGL